MILRRVSAIAVLLVAALALYRVVWVPHHCNVVKKQVGQSIEREWERRHTAIAFDAGARNEPVLARAIDRCPHDVALLMLAGSNQALMNRYDKALQFYERALQFDRRPELHMAAGIAQYHLGRREDALRNFVTAANFAGGPVLVDVPDAELRFEAYRQYGERREKALALRGELETRNLIENADFARAGSARTTQTERLGESASAARSWKVVNESGGGVSTALVPSQRRRGGNALHIVTGRERNGVRQQWDPDNRRPRVRTSAWVYVNRGRVCIGSGNGPPIQNACTTGTGRWERLEGISESCPAETTVIAAAAPDGADFLVDEIAARRAIGVPCER